MESTPIAGEAFPPPPPHFLPDESQTGRDVRIHHARSPFSPLPPPPSFSFSPGVGCSTQVPSPPPSDYILNTSPAAPAPTPRLKFASYDTQPCRSPAVTSCPACQTRVTTQVTHRVGAYAWLMCFVFVLCGLLLGCCLIPFFVKHFKDAYHSCPRCHRVLHIHRKTCCK